MGAPPPNCPAGWASRSPQPASTPRCCAGPASSPPAVRAARCCTCSRRLVRTCCRPDNGRAWYGTALRLRPSPVPEASWPRSRTRLRMDHRLRFPPQASPADQPAAKPFNHALKVEVTPGRLGRDGWGYGRAGVTKQEELETVVGALAIGMVTYMIIFM